MAPTVQNQGQRSDGKRSSRGAEKMGGLVTRVKYCNALPDIPFDPKFIRYPFDANRFVEYKPTSLEKVHKTELHTDHDLGVVIDLINPETYKVNPIKNYLDPADEILLEEDLPAPQDSKRSKQHSLNVSWLRRSEYISQEFNRYGVKAVNIETRIGAAVKDLFNQEELYKDRDGQLAAIQKTFEDAKTDITKHYSKPNVYPVDVLPIYPDFKMWQHPSAQVIFDTDPAIHGKSNSEQTEEMSQAMIRGMVDEEGDQFVAYFLPTHDTIRKRKRDQDEEMEYEPDDTYDYKLAREYNWNVKNKATKGYEENYYFVFREDGVYFNELETRVRLSKRRAKGGVGVQPATNAVLAVTHRDLNEQEEAAQDMRRTQLEALEQEDDVEVEEENEDNEEAAESGGEDGRASGSDENVEMKSDQEDEAENSDQEAENTDQEAENTDQEAENSDVEADNTDHEANNSDVEADNSDVEAESSDEDRNAEEKRDEEEIFGSASDVSEEESE